MGVRQQGREGRETIWIRGTLVWRGTSRGRRQEEGPEAALSVGLFSLSSQPTCDPALFKQ